MPIEPIVDPADYDPAAITIPMETVREINPQRGTFEHLDGILELDTEKGLAVGVRHVPAEPFWKDDHFPGRPLLPGVLMLESMAQLGCYYYHIALPPEGDQIFGFGGLRDVTFRGAVVPGDTILFAARCLELRRRRGRFLCQGFVEGKCVVEAEVIGMPINDKSWNAAAAR